MSAVVRYFESTLKIAAAKQQSDQEAMHFPRQYHWITGAAARNIFMDGQRLNSFRQITLTAHNHIHSSAYVKRWIKSTQEIWAIFH